jgi:hypothetical protein
MQATAVSQIHVRQEASEGEAKNESALSAVSWPAVVGGALVAAALSLILLALGTGLGLSSVSPWANSGVTAATLGTAAIVWLLVMQAISFGMGGYLSGRLRTKWVNVHSDEVYFRDTAHGFLVWALAVAITASVLTSAATSMVSGTVQAGATALSAAAGGAAGASAAPTADPNGYFVDSLFRSDRPADASDPATRAEVGRIFTIALAKGDLSLADKAYVAHLVAARTGLSQADAETRVASVAAEARRVAAEAEAAAREAADKARKAAAHLGLWIFVALLVGAFCSSYSATIGGRQRDHLPAV